MDLMTLAMTRKKSGESGGSSGGGGIMFVAITKNDGTWTADKTFEEIAQAIDNGMFVYLDQPQVVPNVDTNHNYFPLSGTYFMHQPNGFVTFRGSRIDMSDSNQTISVTDTMVIITDSNSVTYQSTQKHITANY